MQNSFSIVHILAFSDKLLFVDKDNLFYVLTKIQFKLCAGTQVNREICDSDQLNQFQHRLVTVKHLKHTENNRRSVRKQEQNTKALYNQAVKPPKCYLAIKVLLAATVAGK